MNELRTVGKEETLFEAVEAQELEKKRKKGSGDSDLQSLVRRACEAAIQHFEEELEPAMREATDYYHSRPLGNEKANRSQVVSSVVRDATQSQLGPLMDIFSGSDHTVEFKARRLEQEELALQATETVRFVVTEENPGFLIIHSLLKDALVRRLGVAKWWWEEDYKTTVSNFSGLLAEQIAILQQAEGVTVQVTGQDVLPMITPMGQSAQTVYSATVIRHEKNGCAKFCAVPPEEVAWTPNSRTLDEAPCFLHSRMAPIDEVVGLGIDRDFAEERAGEERVGGEQLEGARQFHETSRSGVADEDTRDDLQQLVMFTEAYILVDGEERSERRRFRCVGPNFDIDPDQKEGELVDEIPFAIFERDPEPHTLIGRSNYDDLKDLQRIDSQLWRGLLDSMSMHLDPVTEVVAGEVNLGDLIKPDANKIVRVRRPGMMREVASAFLGADALPVIEMLQGVKEDRTGTSRAAAGLDADALQSSTKAAVAATLSGAQQRIKLIARTFAETGMKQLFRGLLRLLVKHQDRTKVIRLRGKYVEVDPRAWDVMMDLQVNVGLGQGTPEDKVALIGAVHAGQMEMMQLGVPFVSFVEIRRGLAKGLSLAGLRPDDFYKPWGAEEQAQYEQQLAAQPPKPSPEEMIAQAEVQKVQAQIQIEQQKLELQRIEQEMTDDRERDRMTREFEMKKLELEMKYKMQIDQKAMEAAMDRDRMQQEMAHDSARSHAELALEQERGAHELELQREKSSAELHVKREIEHKKADNAHEAAMVAAKNKPKPAGGSK